MLDSLVKRLLFATLLAAALATLAPDVALTRGTGAIHRARALLIAIRRRRKGAARVTDTLPALEAFDGAPETRWISV